METNPIIEELQALAKFNWPERQQKYFDQMVQDARAVQCVHLRDVFTPNEIYCIMNFIKPKSKQCYKNAVMLASMFPERVKYVEGFGYCGYCKIDHAFNKVGDLYVDITFEKVLKHDIAELPYVALIEADFADVWADIQAHNNITGEYYQHK